MYSDMYMYMSMSMSMCMYVYEYVSMCIYIHIQSLGLEIWSTLGYLEPHIPVAGGHAAVPLPDFQISQRAQASAKQELEIS